MNVLPPDRLPVIVAVGEVTDRPDDPALGLEPLALMAEALSRADADAGGGWLARIGALDIVNQMTWRYTDLASQLCGRLGIAPRRAVVGPVGGETPVRFLNDAALRIVRGEAQVAALCGGEAQYTLDKARQAKRELGWTPLAPKTDMSHLISFLNRIALNHAVVRPVQVYPLYESATLAAWGQSPAEALAESGALWERLADAAAANPQSWSKRTYSATEITRPSPENRLVAWPYTKRMVANPAVNMGAAIIVTSLQEARAAGIPTDRLVYIWGGAAATDPRDFLVRDQYSRSPAQDVVLEAARTIADADAFDHLELYSCFPVVPKMARRSMDLANDVRPSITGGLSFFGGPINDYMGHAIAAMARAIRAAPESIGLLYGQGEYVTKHHAVVLAGRPPRSDGLGGGYDRQAEADARRRPAPTLTSDYAGVAAIEACTVLYDREGEPERGVIIARTPDGARLMASIPAADSDSLGILVDAERPAVGVSGMVRSGIDRRLVWSA